MLQSALRHNWVLTQLQRGGQPGFPYTQLISGLHCLLAGTASMMVIMVSMQTSQRGSRAYQVCHLAWLGSSSASASWQTPLHVSTGLWGWEWPWPGRKTWSPPPPHQQTTGAWYEWTPVPEPGHLVLQQLSEREQPGGHSGSVANLLNQGHEWAHVCLVNRGDYSNMDLFVFPPPFLGFFFLPRFF